MRWFLEQEAGGPRAAQAVTAGRTASFVAVIAAQVTALAAAGLLAVGAPKLAFHIRPAAAITDSWPARRAESERRVAADPSDAAETLRLAAILISEGTSDAQRRYQRPGWADYEEEREHYQAYMTLALAGSPAIASARSLAQEIAQSGADPQLRARAWEMLSVLAALADDRDERLRCLERAWKAFPCAETRTTLESARN